MKAVIGLKGKEEKEGEGEGRGEEGEREEVEGCRGDTVGVAVLEDGLEEGEGVLLTIVFVFVVFVDVACPVVDIIPPPMLILTLPLLLLLLLLLLMRGEEEEEEERE